MDGTSAPNQGTAASEATSELTGRLMAHFASPAYTPPMLPAVALEVHSIAQKANVDVSKVIAVLEKDPLLAARVLKIAGSATYAPVNTIRSLQDAVVRVGMRNLADIAWEVAFTTRVFRAPRYSALMETIQRHSTACAYLARLVGRMGAVGTEYAFLCGLLHDVGMAAALIALSEPGGNAAAASPPDVLVAPVLKMVHEEASRTVARLWKLPDEVQQVVGDHHGARLGEAMPPLIATLIVSEQMAVELGAGVLWNGQLIDPPDPEAQARARALLRLDDAKLEELRAQASKVMEDVARPAAASAAPAPAPRPAPAAAPRFQPRTMVATRNPNKR